MWAFVMLSSLGSFDLKSRESVVSLVSEFDLGFTVDSVGSDRSLNAGMAAFQVMSVKAVCVRVLARWCS